MIPSFVISSPQGTPLATLVPISPHGEVAAESLLADRAYLLSRFAFIRQDAGDMVLESPCAHARVLLHDDQTVVLLHALRQPQTIDELARRLPRLPASTLTELLTLLLGARMLTWQNGQGTAEDEPDLRSWEFHDLLFHARSRSGRHANPVGGTYRFAGSLPPPPPLTIRPSIRSFALHRPDLDRLELVDRPFALVQESRRTIRNFGQPPMTAAQLGEFLYRIGRITDYRETEILSSTGRLRMSFAPRPYPAGGALYELELYPVISACGDFPPGLYRYEPQRHQLDQLTECTAEFSQLLQDAGRSAQIAAESIQVLFVIAARFQRVAWKYSSIAYALTLKHVGVLLQTMYLTATAMDLAPCAIGVGDADLFARAAGTNYYDETSVGEFLLGST